MGKVILTEATRDELTQGQMEVVSIGAPADCLDWPDCDRSHGGKAGELHCHLFGGHIGDWVLVRHRSLTETHEAGLYCAHQDDVLAVLQP